MAGNTGDMLVQFWNADLIIRCIVGTGTPRTSARQFVSHGHVFVNGKGKYPSYLCKDEVITLKPTSSNIPAIKKMLDDKTFVPAAG